MVKNEESRFEQLIGNNMDAFRLMLDGALKHWEGTHDVLFPDTQTYLIGAKRSQAFSPLCGKIREFEEGENLCLQSDLDAARKAEEARAPVIYPCHAGLRDIAVPIIVNDELVAAVFCGQARPKDEDWEALGLEETINLEKSLNVTPGELVKLRQEIPQVSDEELQELSQRIFTMARFVAQMLETNLERQKAYEKLALLQEKQEKRREHHEQIERAVAPIFSLSETPENLWDSIQLVLQQVVDAYSATHGLFLLQEFEGEGTSRINIQLAVNLPRSAKKLQLDDCDHRFNNWNEPEDVQFLPFRDACFENLTSRLDKAHNFDEVNSLGVISVRVRLSDNAKGLILLFLSENEATEFELEEEKAGLNMLASRIAQSYQNTSVYMAQVAQEEQHRVWLRRVSHQIIAPLNGLVGHAESLMNRIKKLREGKDTGKIIGWAEDDLTRWNNTLDSILLTATWAAHLTRNLAWMGDIERGEKKLQEAELEPIRNVADFLIECARIVQGTAQESDIRKVHVDSRSVSLLDGRLHVNADYFRQAVVNLLDNAVKYSDAGTSIIIDAQLTSGHGKIRVTNVGIRLREEDRIRIFDYEVRTEEAMKVDAIGTGIGLPIARAIVELHGGTLSTEASRPMDSRWQTTFTISLPLMKRKK